MSDRDFAYYQTVERWLRDRADDGLRVLYRESNDLVLAIIEPSDYGDGRAFHREIARGRNIRALVGALRRGKMRIRK
jgi:hypothetical protein